MVSAPYLIAHLFIIPWERQFSVEQIYVKFIFWQKSTQRLITIFQQNMSKKLFRGSNPWDKPKAPCLGHLKWSVILKRKAHAQAPQPLPRSWISFHHRSSWTSLEEANTTTAKFRPFTEPSRKRQTVQENRPSNKTKQKPHQPQRAGHTKRSSRVIWPCNCTDLRTTKGSRPCSRPGPAPLLEFSGKLSPSEVLLYKVP